MEEIRTFKLDISFSPELTPVKECPGIQDQGGVRGIHR